MPEATKSSKATVVVGCRYPHGLLLRVFDMVKANEVLPGGRQQTVEVAQPRPLQIKLAGYANPLIPVAADGRGQYGVTRNVPADFFAEWLKQNKDSDIVKNRIVFAADDDSELKAAGKDFRGERMGLEPLDPAAKDPRTPSKIKPGKAPDEEAAA